MENKNLPEWSLGDLLVWAGGKKERIGTVVGIDRGTHDIWIKWNDRDARQCMPRYRQKAWYHTNNIRHYPVKRGIIGDR